jgi:alpha-galactosidase
MPRVTFIGAGSTVFARNLLRDLFLFPELRDCDIALMDIDPQRLADTEMVARRTAERMGARPTITATTDRRAALDGAQYVINMIQVGGYKPSTLIDFEIPKRYGLQQTIADTLGIGGIMRALRTIPVMQDIAHDMEALCPGALLINYTNPMATLVWAMHRSTPIKTVGLCHSVQGTAGYLARLLGIPPAEVTYLCAGINHMAFYLHFTHRGRDLYPDLHRLVAEGRVPDHDRVRFHMLGRLGYFVTESSEHFSEYVPWFIKRTAPELIEAFNIPLDEYIRRCEVQIEEWNAMRETLYAGSDDGGQSAGAIPSAEDRMRLHSGEYGTLIIHGMESGEPQVIYGNVINDHLIDNLPHGCCVEVPCLVDRAGVQPTRVGALPPHLAALIRSNVAVQELTVEAAITGKREHIYHAAMLDPHTAAELTLSQIWALVDDLIAAHGDYLPHFA